MDIIENVYKSFLKAGFSPKQAKALTAEVGRENNFNSKYVYGSHQDAANNKTNVGFFSWQGERGKELVSNLKNKGLYKNNRIVESQEALDEMAKYTMYEIQNKGAYKKTKERFLSNPDISQSDAAEVLGRDFIRWDMDGKHINNVADHKRRRDNFYNKLNTNQYKTTEIKASKETEEQTPYINPIDFNTPEYSGMTFSEEEAPQIEQTPQEASQDLLEESFLEEADAMLAQSQTQPIQEYEPAPQYNVELNPIEYQPIAQFQSGGIIKDNMGQWKYPGELTEIASPNITMKGVNYPVLGISKETGEQKLMMPNKEYSFKNTNNVLEIPYA
jgi:hypothetical protein